MARRDKINYYLDLAEAVAHRSTCLRRHYGAVIVQTIRLYRQAIRVRREAERIAAI